MRSLNGTADHSVNGNGLFYLQKEADELFDKVLGKVEDLRRQNKACKAPKVETERVSEMCDQLEEINQKIGE